jgi:CCR4-NOT transcription complex subunit 4
MKPISLSVPPLANNAAFPLPTPSPVIPPPIKEKKDKKEKAAEKAAAAAMAMARGKSNDSSQSATTGSAHPSPKKKPISLSTATITKNVPVPLPVSKPPGIPLPVPTPPAQLPSKPTEQIPLEEPQEGSVSAESEAGPSSSSPAPQTPTRQEEIESLPPPLTAEPIYFHSPYEEPLLFPFPSSDPEFAYVLGLEVDTSKRSGSTYQPSPFSRTLVGLAELGVLAPELPLPDLTSPAEGSPSEGHRFKSSFQPFEPMRDVVEEDMESSAVDEEEADVPRTTSRFDFARPSSRSTVARGQSPFAITRRGTVSDERDPWGRSTSNPTFTGLSFTPNREASSSNLGGGMGSGMGMRISGGDGDARQAMGFAGSTSGATGAGGAGYAGQSNDGWGQQSQSQTQQTQQGSDSPYVQNSQTQRRTESHGYKESNRDDFESGKSPLDHEALRLTLGRTAELWPDTQYAPHFQAILP